MHTSTFIENYISDNRIHSKSLISTIFGDLVMPIDGYTWVECLTEMAEPLGVKERLVRTSLFRLCDEQWLYSTKAGRRSFYRLTSMASERTKDAEKLIYRQSKKSWNGEWTLLLAVKRSIEKNQKRLFAKELNWSGFGSVTNNVWAYPGDGISLASRISMNHKLSSDVIIMRSKNVHDVTAGFLSDDKELANLCLPNTIAKSHYERFINNFKGLVNSNGGLAISGSDRQLLTVRLMLLDEYRRAILKDHHLPRELQPEKWLGDEAYALFKTIYDAIFDASNRYYKELQAASGASPITYKSRPRTVPL